MIRKYFTRGGIAYHLLFLILVLLNINCGDFVRDQQSLPDTKLHKDTGFDTEEILDTTTDTPSDLYEDNSDITEDKDVFSGLDAEDDIQDIIQLDDLLSDYDINPQDDIATDSSTFLDISFDDVNQDTSTEDIFTDVSDDTSLSCDCDAGSNCGKCFYPETDGLSNQALKDRLYQLIKDHNSLGYDNARVKMFSEIDNKDGWVECVYTGFKLQTSGVPNSNIMNTEHTWPQSMGADNEPARSDLFHLFPTKSDANSRRGNYPFGTVVNIDWSEGGSKLGTNAKGTTVFEPRDVHKGNVARAMFYFSVRYRLPIDNEQEAELRKWHTLDPVDSDEVERCNKINSYQKNRNPFVDWPDFVNRIENF